MPKDVGQDDVVEDGLDRMFKIQPTLKNQHSLFKLPKP